MEVKIHGQIDLNQPEERTAKPGHFTKELFNNLPGILKAGTDVLTGNDRDVFLVSALAAISSVLPNYQTIYDGKPIESNLYIFLLGNYGSGKGAASYAHTIVRPVHNYLRAKEPPPELNKDGSIKKQVRIVLFLPANSSKSGVIELLANSGNKGLIFETESDTLTGMLKQDYGDWSNILRMAYQHEPITFYRRKDSEYHDITDTKLSVLLTGTPGQLRKLIPSAENGLFSRFNYFLLESEPNFKNVFDTSKSDLTRHFYEIGEQVLELYTGYLESAETPLKFSFTEPQKIETLKYFGELKEELINTYGDIMAGSVNRFGLQFTRIAMVLTALRNYENDSFSKVNYCNDIDYQSTKKLMEVFIWHALNIFDNMANTSNLEDLTEVKKAFYNTLPVEFKTSEAVTLAEQFGLSESTVKRFIDNVEFFENLRHGQYKKRKQ